ncbi:MAG TPA: SpoIID/LytB domain-containing protein [Planctomycetota bacterium]|nr:SpoIID/LytB domain-containing protein [Planctomycetota bacterium]
MQRQRYYHAIAVVVSLWLVFVAHSCTLGRPVKAEMHLGEVTAAPLVQVGLGRCLRDPSARIAVQGPYEVRARGEVLSRGDDLDWVEVRAGETGVQIGGTSFAENPVTVVPLRDGTLSVEYSRDHRGNPLRPAPIRYHGSLLVHALPDRKLALVNEVDLELYLKGVVGKEMNLAEGEEALKTQVIAARTYAVHEQRLERLRRVKGERFDLYDDERSQVYGGMERETASASRLVDETRGLFLVYENRLVRTFYSSCCGGCTEPAWEVLQDETERMPPLQGRKCDYCMRRSIYRWKEPVVVSKKEISDRCLPKDLPGARVKSVEIAKTLPGGHALEVAVSLENSARVVRLQANSDFRRLLQPSRFRSLLWDRIEDRGDTIAIWGRGFGHGAGMCQVGAYEMAKDGKTCAEILEYYFPGAKVQKLY